MNEITVEAFWESVFETLTIEQQEELQTIEDREEKKEFWKNIVQNY